MNEFGQHEVARRSLAPREFVESGPRKGFFNGPDAVGALGMTLGRLVVCKVRLADEQGGHAG
jgi:hypothetical protein